MIRGLSVSLIRHDSQVCRVAKRQRVVRAASHCIVVYAIVLVTLGLLARPAWAQYSSNLQGQVMDPSRAAVPNAKIDLTNTGTRVTVSTSSDSSGNYLFNSLPPGDYEIAVSASGFETQNVKFTLTTAQTVNLPVTLPVAGSRQTVEVQTQAPVVDTADSRLQMTIESEELHSLPLQGRNFLGLASVTPGVQGLGVLVGANPGACPSGLASTIPDNFATELPVEASANGKSIHSNAFLLDGLDVTSNINGGHLNLSPNPDSVQEVSIETNDFSVEYGRNSSITVRMTTKSGTDQYHGTASDYFTDQHLWARSEFTGASYAPFLSNNYSGTVGGPVIPGHHTYFFGSVEPLRSTFSTGNQAYTFEDSQFVKWAQQNFPSTLGTKLLTQYPVKTSTTGVVSQTAQDIFPTTCGTAAAANIPCSLPMIDTGTYEASPYRNALQWNARIDTYFGKDRLYGSVYRMTHDDLGSSDRVGFDTTNRYTADSVQVNETHTFSGSFINEAMFGYLRPEGINSLTGPFSVPVVSVVGMNSGFGVGFAQGDFIQHNYRWRDVLTLVRGVHNLKFGYEGWHGDDLALFASSYGQPAFQFNNLLELVQDNPYTETNLSYNPLTGQPAKGNYIYTGTSNGAFAQDTWKIKSNLTLTLGFRWDAFPNPYPGKDTLLANFILGSGSSLDQQVQNGAVKEQKHVYNSAVTAYSPRFGFAWDPTKKGDWAVRGGVGAYHDWLTLGTSENSLKGNPPGFILPTFLRGTTNPPIFAPGSSNTFPFGYPYPSLAATTLDSHGGLVGDQLAVGGLNPNMGAPRTYNYTVSVERRLPGQMMVSAGYAGSHSIDQITGSVMNQFGGTDVNRFAGDLIQNNDVLTRLLPSFGSIEYTTNGAKATYNALVLSIEKRFGAHAMFNASYTRSSAWYSGQQYPDQHKIDQYWQPSLFSAPNRLSFTGTWAPAAPKLSSAPVRYLLDGWELSSTVIAQSGYPFTVYTTAPFQPVLNASGKVIGLQPGSGDYNADGYNYDYPNVPSFGYNIPNTSRGAYLGGIFSPSDFPVPTMGTEGNELPGRFRGPGFFDVDFALLKNNRITERVALQLRFEFFNILNHPNLNGVDSNLADATFGQTVATFNPRWLQLGVKLSF
jgi:hypothetical protein